jgi:hypothetical protein
VLATVWEPAVFVTVAAIGAVCLLLSVLLLPETDGIDLAAIDLDEKVDTHDGLHVTQLRHT